MRLPTSASGTTLPLAAKHRTGEAGRELRPAWCPPIAAVSGGRPALGENRPPAGFSDLRLLRNL